MLLLLPSPNTTHAMTVVAATPEVQYPFTPVAPPRVAGYHEFANVQRAEIGAIVPKEDAPNAPLPKLFEPLTIRGVEWSNRLLVAPMCTCRFDDVVLPQPAHSTDSADNGKATDWHLVHYGSLTLRGWGSVLTEATAVVPEGRISPQDAGLWDDEQIASWKRVTDFIHANKGKAGIQLAHAGRKAGTQTTWVLKEAGWTGGLIASDENGGFAKDGACRRWHGVLTRPSVRPLADRLLEGLPRARGGDRRGHQARRGRLRGRRAPCQGRRVRLCPDPRRARVPAPLVRFPEHEQAHRRLRRELRQPRALAARGRARRACCFRRAGAVPYLCYGVDRGCCWC